MDQQIQVVYKRDWITTFAQLAIIVGTLVFIVAYYNIAYRECVSNPLVYSAIYMEETYGHPFSATGNFQGLKNSPIIYFDSINVTITLRDDPSNYLKIAPNFTINANN